jgi:hypothetical protein
MLVDSEPAMAVSQGPTNRSRTKHIDFTMALARDYIQRTGSVGGGLLWNIVLQLSRLLICGQSSLVPVLLLHSGVVSWGLFRSCVPSLVMFSIVSSR